MPISAYLPQDRWRALARGQDLPDRSIGSAMLADISGFTALTEGLQQSLGPRHGAEELTRHLNTVFNALIDVVEKHGGNVLGFAGDAITCWFNDADGNAALRAVACASAMQSSMRALAAIELPDGTATALTLKVAIATGPARRFVVGDPAIQLFDVLAGTTVGRTSSGEHLAESGQVLVDEATQQALGETLNVKEWRTSPVSQERFAVAAPLECVLPAPSQSVDEHELTGENWQSWLPVAVKLRSQADQAAFPNEFRPCVALFLRFGGVHFDEDVAQATLDEFVSELQTIAKRYEGALIQLTIGDKGSYAYVNFGALVAHEDDARRAVRAALDMQHTSRLPLQMGLAQGLMHVGTYGGDSRKTFGALGDDANLAARLMTIAGEGEILVSGHVHKAAHNDFTFDPRVPLPMKGKAEPLPVFAVTGERRQRAVRLQEPRYALPMVGRQMELQAIEELLDLASKGKSQLVGIVAEAGMGKSRLVAEVIRSARRAGFVGFGGACQSDGVSTPYLAWRSIWQAFFEIDPEMPTRRLIRWLEAEIEDHAPLRVNAMPLLNTVLDLNIPENDFTRNLEPRIRQSALHALLEDCLKAAARDEPLLIVIEDLHWIDALSHDLLEQLARALVDHAVCFVLAYRPPDLVRLQAPRLEALPQFSRFELHELNREEGESAIRAKLASLYPARSGTLPRGLVDALMTRAQGNPFYLEELLNYVRDRGLDPADLEHIELPDSLHSLILSRIDRLTERAKDTLRVASIVGRLFRAKWLAGYYPELGEFPLIIAALDELEALDLTPVDTREPELVYLFKHIVTHEVTYESMPYATRARLHGRLAGYLEEAEAGVASLDLITSHYGRSENAEKKRDYLRLAGEAAQKRFANNAALDYYRQLLPLLTERSERAQIHMQRGQVLELSGEFDEAEADYRAALELTEHSSLISAKSAAQLALGKLYRSRGDYVASLAWLTQAKSGYEALDPSSGLGNVLFETGIVFLRKGDYLDAQEALDAGLAITRELGNTSATAQILTVLGQIRYLQGDYLAAQSILDESLALLHGIGDKPGVADTVNSLGALSWARSDFAGARSLWEESLALRREMGDKAGISSSLNNLGNVALAQGDYDTARRLFEESLALDRDMGDRWGVALLYQNLGLVALAGGDSATALQMLEESLALRNEMGEKWGIAISQAVLGTIALVQGNHDLARALFEECLELCEEMEDKPIRAHALLGLGLADLSQRKQTFLDKARRHITQSLRLRQEMGEQLPVTSSLIGMASLVYHEGNPERAAQLLGTVDSALRALGAVTEPEILHLHAEILDKVQETLSEKAFRSAWEEGATRTLGVAVAMALD